MLCVVSSTPRRFAYWWRMPPLASAVEPEQTVSRSSTTTGPTPRRARWYAVLTPMMPAPTIRTSAVCDTPATIRQARAGLNRKRRRPEAAEHRGACVDPKPLEPSRQGGDHGHTPRGDRGEGGTRDGDDRSGVGHGGRAVARVRGANAFTRRGDRRAARADPPARSGPARVHRG